jgi:type I restriction enzyme S subunit
MSSQWKQVALGEIARPVTRQVEVIAGQPYRTIGVRWWGEGAYERSTIDGSQTAARTLSIVREGDLIINKIWVRHGSAAIASSAVDGCVASGEFPTFNLDLSGVLSRWIHWQTRTPSFWEKCDALSRGTSGKNRIKPQLFLTIRIPLPPLDEQHRVVSRIEEFSSKVRQVTRLHEETKTDQARMLLAAYGKAIQGAEWLPMEDVVPLVRRAVQVEPLGEYHELGIRSFGKGTFHKPSVTGATLGSKRLFRIEPGDLLFNIVFAWEGAVAVAQPNDVGRVGSHRFLTCVPKDGQVLTSFIAFHFLTDRGLEDLGIASPGGAGRNRTLGIESLAKIKVPVPAPEKQRWFGSLLEKAEGANRLRTEVAIELDALMPSILSKAFRGDL